jgi:hypothetical protein
MKHIRRTVSHSCKVGRTGSRYDFVRALLTYDLLAAITDRDEFGRALKDVDAT